MKINLTNDRSIFGKRLLKMMMRTLIFTCCFTVFSLSPGDLVSQDINITIDTDKIVSVDEVFKLISDQTDYNFIYSEDFFEGISKVNLKKGKIEMSKLLGDCLSSNNLNFILRDPHTIIIKEVTKKEVQDFRITGNIKDQQGFSLTGVTVKVKNKNRGNYSDFEGNYDINASKGDVLVFSYIGFKTKEVVVKDKSIINVILEEDVSDLDEIVITGYQTKNKRETSSAVTVIKAKDLDIVGIASVENMIQGQIAGVSVVTSSAEPGAAPRIRVRGTATLSGNAEPIWVVDGVMLENGVPATPAELNDPDFLKSFNSSIGGVNPNDIESLTILKDASATAIYGTRAANGVIVVTTKKGKSGKPRISFNHTTGIKPRPTYEDFDLMNSQERAEFSFDLLDDGIALHGGVGVPYYQGLYKNGGISEAEYIAGIRKTSEMNVDWFDLLFRNAVTNTSDISFSGGSNKSNYYASLSHTSEDGLDKTTGYKSYSAMAKVNTELSSRVNLGLILNASKRDREQNYTTNAFDHAYSSSRSLPAFNDDGSYYFDGNYNYNILHEQSTTNQTSKQHEIRATLNLDYKITDWLTYNNLMSYTYSGSVTQQYATDASKYVASIRGYNLGAGSADQIADSSLPFGGVFNQSNFSQESYLLRNSLNTKFNPVEDLSVDIMAGTEFRNVVYDGLNTQSYGYFHDRGKIFYNPQESEENGEILRNTVSRSLYDRSFISYFSTFSSMFKNKYVINANIRFDGSNLFGSNPDYRYLPLWSVSGKWHIDQESFLDSADFVDALSIRASYGLRGNIVEEASPQVISTALPPNRYTSLPEQQIIQAANPELKWETTETVNIGIDFSLFNRRLSGAIDLFRDLGNDLISYKNVSSVTGFQNKAVNYANVMNQGMDLGLNAKIIKNDNFSYNLGINASFTDSEVTKSFIEPSISSLLSSTYTVGEVVEGMPINSMYSYRFSRINEEGAALFFDGEGNEYGVTDANFRVNIQDNKDALKYEGSRVPTTTLGITNRFNYKNFQLSFLLVAGLDYKIRLQNLAFNSEYIEAESNLRRGVENRWRQPGDESFATIPWLGSSSYLSTQADMFNNSDAQTINGDYVRLRNVLLQYSLPKSLIEKAGFSNAVVKFQVDNLFVLADKRLQGMDPETANFNTSFWGGSLPLPKTFTLGISLNL
ncbi:SusC/RagA family TonB-linked outer membrane protein [Polaribacter sp. AHE13PA]|uniref:SusC/RagA family TonB-linked outer membrane protein n=1 Tax=Polaribacter sp. AHE13PA TaxID=2745562 RepID=UPI001C4E6805|nr:SusC/RagA family TonB-linked outer membrane protein [Polaribacter sp. AHE13PA]QXP66638.1 SusC/RagA family TonB-linked outer membrane protein [Polaribacter sp. AHE13PA]